MLRPEDQNAIEDLFERLRNVERNSGPRDPDAEQLIFQHLRENPSAAYFMAQTIIVQEAALREAQQRLEQQESRSQQGSGGFLGNVFGEARSQPAPSRPSPWGRASDQQNQGRAPAAGGGFLAGAAQTALGVTGGMLLGSALGGLFSNEAQASEAPPADTPEDPGMDSGGGDSGDFDIGGDF
jgi:hypothetical protein